MKTLTLLFLITINFSMYAQESIFVRVYNSAGTKISKGHVLIVTDSSLQLSEEKSNIIPLSSIDYIKIRKSKGNNVLIGSILGATVGAILGGGMNDGELHLDKLNFNRNKATAVGMVAIPIGAGIGELTNSFKKLKTYLINGDLTKWKAFQSMLTGNSVSKYTLNKE